MKRMRYLVKAHGDDQTATVVGIAKFMEGMKNHKKGVVVVPNLSSVNGGLFENALGKELAELFVKEREINIADGKTIYLCTRAALKDFGYADVYLLLWGGMAAIEAVEALTSWSVLIEVTWLEKDASYWQEKHKPKVIYP